MNWQVGRKERLQRRWYCLLLAMLAAALALGCGLLPARKVVAQEAVPALSGLQLAQPGTQQVHFTYHGKPLLSFGGLSDFIFYAASDAYDYKLWADWAAAHGMNHLRAYPPFSWTYIEHFAQENGGSQENLLFPYEEIRPGSRQFDLTRFNEAYWQRFRQQCEYLQSKGIIIHLLMMNGWQLLDGEKNWQGHFFNPDNNINEFSEVLADNRLGFYQSVSQGQTALVEAQKAWLRKLVEMTADLDNVYYDLVHEIAENYRDWPAMQAWIDEMARTVRSRYEQLQPERPIILGMDTGGLERSQRQWIFSRPYFDLLIYGKSHRVENAINWRKRFKKPYIPQEAWDEDDTKYGFREPSFRVHLRKYLWKFMMAKCQQMDIYIKPRIDEQLPGYPHNYDPNGWNPFERDAKVLRETWDRLQDYANLAFTGQVQAGPGAQQAVLSSEREALVYLSSATGKEKVAYAAGEVAIAGLDLQPGAYRADLIKPDQGLLTTAQVTVSRGRVTLAIPAFIDDLAIHLIGSGQAAASGTSSENGGKLAIGWGLGAAALALCTWLFKTLFKPSGSWSKARQHLSAMFNRRAGR